jgi:capsular polysaccharide biosynthesis protein
LRNKVDLTATPETLLLNPWQDRGLKLLCAPAFFWRETKGAIIDGFAVSAHAEINAKTNAFITTVNRQKRFRKCLEINAVPAVVERASFRKSHIATGGKLVLSGASATRLLNSYRVKSSEGRVAASEQLNEYLKQCRAANEGKRIAVENVFVESDLDFAVECRNTFNYFHFITESLCQLCVLDDIGFQGNIYFHFPNQREKQRDFAASFVQALFPEYSGRVFFERAPKDYDLVLTSFEFVGAIGQMPETDLVRLAQIVPDGVVTGSLAFLPILAMNSVNSSLLALRARALKAIEGMDFSHLPTRFFVGRGDAESRARPLAGQNLLIEHLMRFGFDYMVFEDHPPLEQIALMARAEMMISQHGAGFTNMLFASPETFVIELGTLQTAQLRWADFWPLAHAAKCRYISFFADFSTENPVQEPKFSTDGIVPTSVTEKAAAQIMTFVVTLLGQVPTMPDAVSLAQLGMRVLRAGAAAQAIDLLAKHEPMVHGNLDLCLLLADCHKALDEPKSELLALEAAFKADPSRWQTLVRIIWCANRIERPQVIRWALARLAADFPERHDAFVSNHDWVRFVG